MLEKGRMLTEAKQIQILPKDFHAQHAPKALCHRGTSDLMLVAPQLLLAPCTHLLQRCSVVDVS